MNFSDRLIETATLKLEQGIFYKDIFKFHYMREERIKKINLLKKYEKDYWCGYFESNQKTQKFPKIHFLIIDTKEVIFASYDYNNHYCSIFDREIVNIMLSYFEESWSMCKKIIDLKGFHQNEFNSALLDSQTE
ncbi:MAG: hypothetical protein K2K63_12940, partial [Acetatifactor sp.]|nr:hypothetical protein [Acetatifactor sp.]